MMPGFRSSPFFALSGAARRFAGVHPWHHGAVFLVPFSARSIDDALGAGSALLEVARAERTPCLAASLIEGPAVLLGLHQRAARVLDVAACQRANVRVFRRATAGTAAFAGKRALVFSLALPQVAALFPDASFRTLLNRNVRPFLKGFSAAGALAHYFGREWVSLRKRPGAVLGFDVAEDGAVLIEVIAGFDESIEIPPAFTGEHERSIARYTGHAPTSLAELLRPGAPPDSLARAVADAFAARASTRASERPDLLPQAAPHSFALDLAAPDSLVPPGATLASPVRIPIGWLELALLPGQTPRLWLGGDLLAPRFFLDRIAASRGLPSPDAPATDTPRRDVACDPTPTDAPRPAAPPGPMDFAAAPHPAAPAGTIDLAAAPRPAAPPGSVDLGDAPLDGVSVAELLAAVDAALHATTAG